VRLPRASGILLHLTSLPSGKLDEEAYRFVDWLQAAGQTWWQILPVGPPDESGSPYRASSAFAAWNGFLAEPDAPVSAEEIER
jgi:4-alpha-glucanotransferase